MIETLFQSTSIPVLEQVANFTQSRHQVLAGNIANLDTPGYRTRDPSSEAFENRLRQAIALRDRQHGPISLGDPTRRGDPVGMVRESLAGMLRHDDGNVGIEQQVTAVAKNHMQHNLALTLLASQFRMLGTAIAERT